MMFDMTYSDALDKAEHLIALGQTTVYLRDKGQDFPWDKAVKVESGNSHRLSGPSSMYVIAEDGGLQFKLNVEFEDRDANGRGVSLFERDRLREVAMRLPPAARTSFANMLEREVLSGMAKRTAEIREAMNAQVDSEDCVRGLIAFARDSGDARKDPS
jgi:hypothetical protein